jgi:hypothetical protein
MGQKSLFVEINTKQIHAVWAECQLLSFKPDDESKPLKG